MKFYEKTAALILLFMVFSAFYDVHTSVDTLEQDNAHKLVGKGHFGDRKLQISGIFYAVVEPVRRADNEAELVGNAESVASSSDENCLPSTHIAIL